MVKKSVDPVEHTLLDRFDDLLEEFHHWLGDIKHRREEHVATIEKEDLEELTKEVVTLQQNKEYVSIESSVLWNFRIIGGIVALVSFFFFQSLSLVYLVVAGIIISMASEKFIRFFQTWLPRGVSIACTYILLVLFLFGGIILVVPFLIQQTAELSTLLIDRALAIQATIQEQGIASMIQQSMLPESLKSTLVTYLEGSTLQQSLQTTLVENISQIVTMGSSYIKNAGDFAVGLLVSTFSALFQIAIVFTVAIFGSIEKKSVSRFIASLSSTPHHTHKTVNGLYDTLGDWLVGQILLCVAVGVLVGVGLMILSWLGLSLPNSFTLALIAGLTEFIPYLGPLLGAVPGVFVATLAFGFKGFMAAGIMYMIVQRTENNILVPLIMSQTLGVSPLLIFVSILILGTLLGLLGVVIAVPIAVILNIMYKEYMKKSLIKEKEL